MADRYPAPDLARGAALLLIAVANAHTFVTGRGIGVRGYPRDLHGADAVVAAVQLVLVDGRGYPLFALLFGFGIATLAARRATTGAVTGGPGPAARTTAGTAGTPPDDPVLATVRRRGAALLAVGAAHAVLLWHGDIVAAYGLLAVLLAGLLVRGSTTALVTTAAGTIALTVLLYAPVALTDSAQTASPSLVEPGVLAAASDRFGEWLFGNLLLSAVGSAGAAALGVLLARSGRLAAPGRHRRFLTRLAVAGIAAGVLGGLPLALVAAGVWAPPVGVALLLGPLHALTGYAAGAGYAAVAGLVADRWARRGGPGPVGRALVATGQRSLSAYLAQSVAFVGLFAAWTLGLGAGLPVWAATLCGAGVWLVTVLVADRSARAGRRGPAETLLRLLTYGRRPAPQR